MSDRSQWRADVESPTHRLGKVVPFDVPINPHVGDSKSFANLTSGQITSVVGYADPLLDRTDECSCRINSLCPAFAAMAGPRVAGSDALTQAGSANYGYRTVFRPHQAWGRDWLCLAGRNEGKKTARWVATPGQSRQPTTLSPPLPCVGGPAALTSSTVFGLEEGISGGSAAAFASRLRRRRSP